MLHLRKPWVLFIVGLVQVVADIDDIGVPTDFKGDLNSRVFCPRFCAKSDCGAGTVMGEASNIR